MLNKPSTDLLVRKLGTEKEPVSRFALCMVASKRARQIMEQNNYGKNELNESGKELSVACREIAEGKVVIEKDSEHNT